MAHSRVDRLLKSTASSKSKVRRIVKGSNRTALDKQGSAGGAIWKGSLKGWGTQSASPMSAKSFPDLKKKKKKASPFSVPDGSDGKSSDFSSLGQSKEAHGRRGRGCVTYRENNRKITLRRVTGARSQVLTVRGFAYRKGLRLQSMLRAVLQSVVNKHNQV